MLLTKGLATLQIIHQSHDPLQTDYNYNVVLFYIISCKDNSGNEAKMWK